MNAANASKPKTQKDDIDIPEGCFIQLKCEGTSSHKAQYKYKLNTVVDSHQTWLACGEGEGGREGDSYSRTHGHNW